MLKTRFIKLFTYTLADGRYLLAVQDEHGRFLPVQEWKDIVFSRHEESFFGTLLEEETIGGVAGVVVSGWALVSLFGREAFNRFIEWDWSESAEICLAASGALYEGIIEQDWHPDFSAWEHEGFRWRLPEQIMNEFDPSFWEQVVREHGQEQRQEHGDGSHDHVALGDVVHGDGSRDDVDRGTLTAKQFLAQLYNDALDTYLTRNPAMKELFGPKLHFLKRQNLSGIELARYFDEETWLEWVGVKENTAPFTIGMRLDEPLDGEGDWTLDVFLRDKKNIDNIYGLKEAPGRWRPFLEKVDREQERWVRLIPWLGDSDMRSTADPRNEVSANAAGAVPRLKSDLSEEEAWMFLTEASETLVALNVEILLPSWWQAMKSANLKVKASLKGTGSHRPSFVGLQAMLDFNWRFSMNGVDLSEDEFNSLVEEKRRLVYIRGRWVKLDPQFIHQIQDLMKRAEKEGLHVRDLLEQELIQEPASEEELENPKAFARIQIELNQQWKKMVKQLSEVKEIPEQPVPEGLNGELRPYQQLGMSWLWFLRQYGFGACLADDMGLGKTVQLIAYLLMVKDHEGSGPAEAAKAEAETAAGTADSARSDSAFDKIETASRAAVHDSAGDAIVKSETASGVTDLDSVGGTVVKAETVSGATDQDAAGDAVVKTETVSEAIDQDAAGDAVVKTETVSGAIDQDTVGGAVVKTEAVSGATDQDAAGDAVVKTEAETAKGSGKRRKQSADDDAKKVPIKGSLIICPTSVLGNWQKELERFAPEMEVYLHYGSNRLKGDNFSEKVKHADVVLTSYGISHLDTEEFERFLWSTIAIDEAQNIKNPQTKQSRAVRRLRGRHHVALTGTPMENRLSELWSIFDFTNHGYLGSIGQFQKKFVIPIEKDENKDKVRDLQAMIRPFLLRRTKKDEEVALNLPDKQEQKEYCPLTAEQASLYEQLVKDTFAEIETLSGFERKGLILQMLSRLKQLCNHPALYLKEKAMTHLLDRSNKMEKLVELVGAVLEQEESCLIFTQYIQMGEMIKTLVKKKFGVEVPFLNGSVPKAQRDTMIERFQNREFPVFLLSLKAGGTGLNLTAANHVIHYDRWWNPAVENQATDRAYRIGQQRFVHVHKLICTGTLEEKIDAMLEKKQFLNDQIIQSENWITELSTDDLRDLVYLGR